MNRLSPLSKERIAELQAAKAETKALKSANLTEHVALHNRMVEAINTYVPKLIEELSKGFKLKDNGCFYKKDQSRFDNLVQELSVEFGFTGRLSKVTFGIHSSSFHLVIQDCYTSGSTEANKGRQSTYELSSYVWDTNTNEPHEFKPVPYLSTKDILDAKAKTDELEKQIQELQTQLQQAKRTTDGFKAHL